MHEPIREVFIVVGLVGPDPPVFSANDNSALEGEDAFDCVAARRILQVGFEFADEVHQKNVTRIGANNQSHSVKRPAVTCIIC